MKAVIVDLDKTLLRSDKTISEKTQRVMEKCRQKGMKLLVATARPQRTMKVFLEQISVDAATVSNGARVLCGDEKAECSMEWDDVKEILRRLAGYPHLRITLETGDLAYSNLPIDGYETILVKDLFEVAKAEGALKLLVHMDDFSTWEIVKGIVPENVNMTIAHGTLIQFQHKRATKWNGVKTMLDYVGCTPEEAIYFGDDHDDIESIRMCGMGIAMANGAEEVKMAADDIARSNDEDGVACYLCDHFNLI